MLAEIQQRVKAGGFLGFIINSSVRGQYLDSERAEPFFAMAAARRWAWIGVTFRPP